MPGKTLRLRKCPVYFSTALVSPPTNQRNPSHDASRLPVAVSVSIFASVISLAVTTNADGKPVDEAFWTAAAADLN
jgi:hypothetical protein